MAASAVHSLCGSNHLEMNVDSEMRGPSSPPKRPRGIPAIYSCLLKVEIANTISDAVLGEGRTKVAARKAAWAHFVAKQHANGSLSALIAGPPRHADPRAVEKPQFIDEGTMAEEKDAKMEIINYTVGLGGLIPTFTTVHRKPAKRNKNQPRRLVQATIELPKHSASVSALGADHPSAEIAAAVAFKKEAQKNAWPRENDGVNWTLLNSETAEDFFRFYRSKAYRAKIEVEQSTLSEHPFNQASVTVDGTLLSSARMNSKKQAICAAQLMAAVELVKTNPGLLQDFQKELEKGAGKFLNTPYPVVVSIPDNTVVSMRTAVMHAKTTGLLDQGDTLAAETLPDQDEMQSHNRALTSAQARRLSKWLQQEYEQSRSDPRVQAMRAKKDSLPMSSHRDSVLELIDSNLYSIVIGATGSGKTTQVPQMLLEEAIKNGSGAHCNVICTQPRRIAAISVANRVAEERCETLQKSVGFHVRHDSRPPRNGGSITYCSTGILVERMKHHPDAVLDSTSHIIIDEVHERDLPIDFLLIVLKRAIKARRSTGKTVPKIILMSATLDHELFSKYLSEDGAKCPSISVPGRTFPVTERYLDSIVAELQSEHSFEFQKMLETVGRSAAQNMKRYLQEEVRFRESATTSQTIGSDTGKAIDWKRPHTQLHASTEQDVPQEDLPIPLVAATIARICTVSEQGAILAFLPGLEEILKVRDILTSSPRFFGIEFNDRHKYRISLLHSTIPRAEQMAIFEALPSGCRRIILSTNIAETSVTVPDVKYVIDSGKLREQRYDQTRRITSLECVWESRSNAKQRAGRAGRVQNGHYYALFSKERHASFKPSAVSQLLRLDLSQTALAIKASFKGQALEPFLAGAIEPPPQSSVQAALNELTTIGALTEEEQITDLGRILSRLPLRPRLGKMVVLGVLFKCLDPMIVIGAAAEGPGLFRRPLDRRQEARRSHQTFDEHNSDHLALYSAFKMLRSLKLRSGMSAARDRASEMFLDWRAYLNITQTALDIEGILTASGLVVRESRARSERSGQHGPPSLNRNAGDADLVKCLLLAGLSPNLAVQRGFTSRTPAEDGVIISPSSLLKRPAKGPHLPHGETLLTYGAMSQSSDGRSLLISDVSAVTPMMSLLFGGRLWAKNQHRVLLNDWLPFFVSADGGRGGRKNAAEVIVSFRRALDRVLSGALRSLLEAGAARPAVSAEEAPNEARFAAGGLSALSRVLGSLDATESRPLEEIPKPDMSPHERFLMGILPLLKTDREAKPIKSSDA